MSSTRLAAIATFATAIVLLAASLFYGRITGAANPGSMEAMSVDMDTTGNAATSLGPRDECVVVSPGSTITLDVTATNIPGSNPMLAFAYQLGFPAGAAIVESADANFLLAALPGSAVWDLGEPLPDGDGVWNAAAIDISGSSNESDSGVLHRLTMSISPAALTGLYPLTISGAAHVDPSNTGHAPNTINNAFIAVNATCDNLPTPTPTPSPAPTLPPAPNDDFADAVVIGQFPFWDAVTTLATSTEPGEPSPCGSIGATVWYAFTATEDALLYAHTGSSDFDTVLAAYTGDGLGGLNLLDCNDNGIGGLQAELTVNVLAGQTLFFQAGGSAGATGILGFYLETFPAPTPTPIGAFAVGIESASVEPGGTVTVDLTVEATSPGIGAFTLDVAYDDARLGFVSCTAHASGLCNNTANGNVRFTGASAMGISGSIVLGTATFHAGGEEGVVPLDVTIVTLTDPAGADLIVTPVDGAITIATTTPTPTTTVTPTPTAVPTPAPSPVPGAPPPFDPGGVICFENLESAPECDGDTAPGAAADIRSKLCVGWNADCSVRDNPVSDSNFGAIVSFMPPEWNLPRGDTISVGALAGRLESWAWLGLLNNACNSRIQVAFTLLNGSINTSDTISPRNEGGNDVVQPLAMDANGNGIPDGADKYPAFLAGPIQGAQPRARLFGVSNIQGTWAAVNILFFEPGAALNIGGNAITFNPALGYPAIVVLQDPTAQAAPSAISDFCAPLFIQYVVLGKTINNPCTPTRVLGANCPITSDVAPDIKELGYPSFPCDVRSKFDDDGDGKVNDGCPQVNNVAETGAQCDNDISDDSEDSSINDGCPRFGDVSEGARIPGACSGGDEGGCTNRSNPLNRGIAAFTTLSASQRDADGDGFENSLDVCALTPNPGWNPRGIDSLNDPDNDGLPTACDPNPSQAGSGSPTGCRTGYTGPDQDQDCFSNRADNCPNDTQLQHPGLPPEYNTNLPFAPDQDSDGIGDACDPNPAAPNGNVRALCLKFALSVGGAAGPAVGVVDPVPGPQCAAQPVVVTPTPAPAPSPTPTPTPTPGPPIDIEVSIDDTGRVVPRDGVATVHGELECDRPALVELQVEVIQRAGRAYIVGVAELAVWCDGREEWSVEAVGNGRFVGGWVDVSVHAEAQAGMSHGSDDEEAQVQLRGGGGPR